MGITEKRLANKRFRKTEEAILRVFFAVENYISIGRLAAMAGVARSTVYNHHRTIWEITVDYEKYILQRYQQLARKMVKTKNLQTKMVYLRILYFILANRKIFEILMKNEKEEIFREMVEKIRPKLETIMRLPKNSQTLFVVYESEVATLMYEWGCNGFERDKMEKILKEILYLTDTARERLKVLLD